MAAAAASFSSSSSSLSSSSHDQFNNNNSGNGTANGNSNSDETPPPPVVFQCRNCHRIIGDTTSLIASDGKANTILLNAVHNIIPLPDVSLQVSQDAHDFARYTSQSHHIRLPYLLCDLYHHCRTIIVRISPYYVYANFN
jgi:hypothetical protein